MYQYTIYRGWCGRHNNFAQGAEDSGAGPVYTHGIFICNLRYKFVLYEEKLE
jgi:hypothetical protein